MPYSNFTLKKVQHDFDIKIFEKADLFSHIAAREISPHLQETLIDNVSLAVSINTEKARSELIVAPVLIEIRKLYHKKISFFSGIEFNIDKHKDLTGFCDFILSQSPEQFFLKVPVITIVEAKNDNIINGLGQCAAEMIAARIYNEQEGTVLNAIYGVVTSGNVWKFLQLENNLLTIDEDDYLIKDVNKIVGILCSMVGTK